MKHLSYEFIAVTDKAVKKQRKYLIAFCGFKPVSAIDRFNKMYIPKI